MPAEYRPVYELTPAVRRLINEIESSQAALNSVPAARREAAESRMLAALDVVPEARGIDTARPSGVRHRLHQRRRSKSPGTARLVKRLVNYTAARRELINRSSQAEPVSEQLICSANRLLMGAVATRGATLPYRRSAVFIRKRLSDAYRPPEAEDVPQLMSAFVEWLNGALAQGISGLICAPIVHYRLVTIHPFLDGNGRTARLLSNYILFCCGIDVARFADIEKQHLNGRRRYAEALRDLQAPCYYDIPRDIDLTSWIEYWLVCLKNTYTLAQERFETAAKAQLNPGQSPRLDAAARLIDACQRLSVRQYRKLTGLDRARALDDLQQLERRGVVYRVGGRHSTTFLPAHIAGSPLHARQMPAQGLPQECAE